MFLFFSLALLPLKLISGQLTTTGNFYTSDDQLRLLSVAGNCLLEGENHPAGQMIKVPKNGSGCALVDEAEQLNYDVFSYAKKVTNSSFAASVTATPPPIDGNWGAWVDASSCVMTCLCWWKQQTRACDSPSPGNEESECSGPSTQRVSCRDGSLCPTWPARTTTAGAEGGALNITDFEGSYCDILTACDGALKPIDPNNPSAVMAAAPADQEYYVDVICPSEPDHVTCSCSIFGAPMYTNIPSWPLELFYCTTKSTLAKGICA